MEEFFRAVQYLRQNLIKALKLLVDVTFIGHGAPEHKTTMYLNGGCGSDNKEPVFEHKISQAEIQPNRTWSVTVSLPLPCRLRWKWKADSNMWEWSGREDRYTNLSTDSKVIYSNFGQKQEVTPKGDDVDMLF